MSDLRKEPEERKREILECALKLSETMGYTHVGRNEISKELQVSRALINTYFGDLDGLRVEIVKLALTIKNKTVLSQAIVDNNPLVECLDKAQKRKILINVLKK